MDPHHCEPDILPSSLRARTFTFVIAVSRSCEPKARQPKGAAICPSPAIGLLRFARNDERGVDCFVACAPFHLVIANPAFYLRHCEPEGRGNLSVSGAMTFPSGTDGCARVVIAPGYKRV